MARTNWSKVEDLEGKGIHDMKVDELAEKAKAMQDLLDDEDADSTLSFTPDEETRWAQKKLTPEQERRQKQLKLRLTLKWLWKQDRNIFKKLKLKRSAIKELLGKDSKEITDEDLKTIDKLLFKLDLFKTKMAQKQEGSNDDTIVESERHRHIYKRFNVNDEWLPLK